MVDIRREVKEVRLGMARTFGRVFLKSILSIWLVGGGIVLGGEAVSHISEPSDAVVLFCLSAVASIAFAVSALLWLIWKGELKCFGEWLDT